MIRKTILPALAVLMFALSPAAPISAQETADSGLIPDAYRAVFGRGPTPTELKYWREHGFGNYTANELLRLKSYLILYLESAKGMEERRATIRRSYQRSFGREPSSDDYTYWMKELAHTLTRYTYEDLMKFQRQYLQNTANETERRTTINRAYGNALGRFPTTSDYNYWLDRMTKEGSNFTEIVEAAINYVWGGDLKQETELRETIKRAYVAAGRANPTNDDINLAMVKLKAKPRVFSKLVEFVKKIDTMTKID
jgi:hypothetical protein